MVNGILFLYPNAVFSPGGNVGLAMVDGVQTIVHWDETVLGLQPSAEAIAAASAEAEKRASVPRSVSMRQARLALLGAGLLNSVTAAINAMPSPQKEAAQIEWEYSQEVHRDKALVQTLGPALGLTDEQMDSLFIAAAAL